MRTDSVLPRTIKVFFSYSHRDERLRDEMELHLSTLKRSRLISAWHDRKLSPGDSFNREIDAQLATADLILLLISANFLSSEYCYTKEMQRALKRHKAGTARVIPIIVRPAVWQDSPIGGLLALPRDGKAVTSWASRDQAWVQVAHAIRRAVDELAGS